MIGIIGAMKIEVEELLQRMENQEKEEHAKLLFTKGSLNGTECVVAQCGPGKVNAALCAQAMLLLYHPSAVISVGVAGGIGRDVKIGDIVLADRTVQHDADTSALGDPVGLVSGINLVEIPASLRLNAALTEAARSCGFTGTVHTGVMASGDQFIADKEKLHWIADTFRAIACEMESGSIAQVCYINEVDFAGLRCISDNADGGASVDFMEFAERAAHVTTDILLDALPRMESGC